MTSPRRVLMVCYHYPPANTGGVQRSLKFARFLPTWSWTPVVLSTDIWGPDPDNEMEQVVRTAELVTIYRRLGGKSVRSRVYAPPQTGEERPAASGLKTRIAHFLYECYRWMMFPDQEMGWVFFALWPALREMRRSRIEAIYTTSPPVSAHLLGLLLKWLTRKPWVMDLRDPWTIEPMSAYLRRGGLRARLEKRLERICFRAADRIILNTPQAAAEYQALDPACQPRLLTITNGFDADQFAEAIGLALPGETRFTISHVGTFSRYGDVGDDPTPYSLLEALKQLRDEGIITPDRCRVVFAGRLHPQTLRSIHQLGLESVIQRVGVLPHTESLRLMLSSDLLILFDADRQGKTYVRGKLYEYLASGRAILGIVGEGANRNLLERVGCTLLAGPEDVNAIRQAIQSALSGQVSLTISPEVLGGYEYRTLARQLAACLDSLQRD